jgi:hypothetical protein
LLAWQFNDRQHGCGYAPHGRYRLGSGTKTSSTPCAIPSWHRIGSRTFGVDAPIALAARDKYDLASDLRSAVMELPKVKEVCSATALQCFLFVALRGDFDEKIGPLLK